MVRGLIFFIMPAQKCFIMPAQKCLTANKSETACSIKILQEHIFLQNPIGNLAV